MLRSYVLPVAVVFIHAFKGIHSCASRLHSLSVYSSRYIMLIKDYSSQNRSHSSLKHFKYLPTIQQCHGALHAWDLTRNASENAGVWSLFHHLCVPVKWGSTDLWLSKSSSTQKLQDLIQ